MKGLLRCIWNYCVGYRDGYIPPFLYERIGQYPYKDKTEVLFIKDVKGKVITTVYIDSDTNGEISYEEWLAYKKFRTEQMRKWRDGQFVKNHPRSRRIKMRIHYWLNNIY